MDNAQYVGKRLTWDEAVSIFPDLWVLFQDCMYNGADFQSGRLVAVIKDDDIGEYLCAHIEENPYYARTTEGKFGGYIHGVIVEKETS